MPIETLTGSDILLIAIAVFAFAGFIKLCMVCNESRISEYQICHGLIEIKRAPMDIEQIAENHDAINEVE